MNKEEPTAATMTNGEADLRALLMRAEMSDLERLSTILDRWPRPARLAEATTLARTSETESARRRLEDLLIRALLRDATSELAWTARRLRGKTTHTDEDLHDAITRSAKKLNVNIVPKAGTISGRLGAMTRAFVDRTLLTMTPEEQHRLVSDGIVRTTGVLPGAARTAQAAMIPALHAAIGTTALLKVTEAVVAQTMRTILGRELARAATRAVVARAPFIAGALGPAAWVASAAMIGWEIQRPADRKVVPALLCLGLIALRDSAGAGR